nr:iron-containing alcohol dehydrogenase [Desulfosediminicola ganghwensis]
MRRTLIAHHTGHLIHPSPALDHAKSLAIIQPAVWRVRKDRKRGKLLQYGKRIRGITKGDEDTRIESAITMPEEFFQQLSVKTLLSDYDIGEDGIERIVTSLENHGMTALLSETQDLSLDTCREILRTAL